MSGERTVIALPARTSNGMLAMLDGIRHGLPPLAVSLALPAAPTHRLVADDSERVAAGTAIVDADPTRGYGDDVKRDAVNGGLSDEAGQPASHRESRPVAESAVMPSLGAHRGHVHAGERRSLATTRYVGQSRLPRPQPDPRERRA